MPLNMNFMFINFLIIYCSTYGQNYNNYGSQMGRNRTAQKPTAFKTNPTFSKKAESKQVPLPQDDQYKIQEKAQNKPAKRNAVAKNKLETKDRATREKEATEKLFGNNKKTKSVDKKTEKLLISEFNKENDEGLYLFKGFLILAAVIIFIFICSTIGFFCCGNVNE